MSANPVHSKQHIEDFQIYDTNRDQNITRKECEEEWNRRTEIYQSKFFTEKRIKQLCQNEFTSLDQDEDGKLDLLEWLYGRFEKELDRKAFQVFDTDNDGKIVVEEVKLLVHKTDSDRDGVVSLKEFTERRIYQ